MEPLVRPLIGNQEKGQCQPPIDNIIIKDTIGGPFIQNVLVIFVIILVIAVYTAIVIYVGYQRGVRTGYARGFRDGQQKIPGVDKMTMTSVTYSWIRGKGNPRIKLRFEYCPEYLAGVWP